MALQNDYAFISYDDNQKRNTYADISEIPADLLDVHSTVEGRPAASIKLPVWSGVLKRKAQETRVPLACL